MTCLPVDMSCRCGRQRLGIPASERSESAMHPCPFAAIVRGAEACDSCHCCPACTILCLPMKVALYRGSVASERGEKFASVYDSAIHIVEE